MTRPSEESVPSMAIKWSHIVFVLVIWLLTLGTIYGSISARMDDHDRRVHELESDSVKKEQFNEMRDDIVRRLDRIESKVDQERQSRSAH